MNHYQDIKIQPDPEFLTPMLMNALVAKLHHVLVQLNSNDIGISFPDVDQKKPSLGDVLRLHGAAETLQNLQMQNWLTGMRDHVEGREIELIPPNAQHCLVRRVQVKSSATRLRRRYCKRHADVTEQEALKLIPDALEKASSLPYLQLKSESTGQHFRLFIEHQPPQSQPIIGEFNCYGLSAKATIPWF